MLLNCFADRPHRFFDWSIEPLVNGKIVFECKFEATGPAHAAEQFGACELAHARAGGGLCSQKVSQVNDVLVVLVRSGSLSFLKIEAQIEFAMCKKSVQLRAGITRASSNGVYAELPSIAKVSARSAVPAVTRRPSMAQKALKVLRITCAGFLLAVIGRRCVMCEVLQMRTYWEEFRT